MDDSGKRHAESICVEDSSSKLKSDIDFSESHPLSEKVLVSTSTESSATSSSSSPTTHTGTATPPSSKESPSMMSGKARKDSGETQDLGSSRKPAITSVGIAEGKHRSSITQVKEKSKSDDVSLGGASSGPTIPPQGGAGEPCNTDMMAKMMAMVGKDGTPSKPGAAGKPKDGMPDMMTMMSKGGMPDMMAMMAKGGMPDMMEMMSKGGGGMPDMAAMMSKMQGSMSGNPMATLFECIVDMSLSRPDSDSSDDDDDGSLTLEIPCQYCSRLFSSQMALKTHILVAHEHEDTSVLNLKKLVIDKGKQSAKGHYGSRRKQSRDCDKSAAVEAAGFDTEQQEPTALTRVVSSQEDLSAAESFRGVKRGRHDRRESDHSELAKTGGAAGIEEGSLRTSSGAVSSSYSSGSSPESRKRSARLRSLRSSSGESSSQVTSKKSRSGDGKPGIDSSPNEDPAPVCLLKSGSEVKKLCEDKSPSSSKETARNKKVKADKKDTSAIAQASVPRGKRTSRKDKDVSSDTETSAETQSAASQSPSQGEESSSATKRSLRSRKSR